MKQFENIKNQEMDLLNQKINNFEMMIEENSNNYINEINMLKTQIQKNKLKIEEYNKYIEIVNIFINKIDYLFGIQTKQIININELQNKFTEIENLIHNILNNNNNNITNKTSKLENNNFNEDINNKSENLNEENESVEKEENNNYEELKVPHFQNEILVQGVNYQINNLPSNREDKYQIFKNLEQRIIDLEKKLYQNSNQENLKIKKCNNHKNINSNIRMNYINNNNENKSNSKNKVLRSKSGKINCEKLLSNQLNYKTYNSNQINYNQPKKGKKIKKTQRKKFSKNNEYNITNQNNNNNDNYSVSSHSTYSNLKNNLVK